MKQEERSTTVWVKREIARERGKRGYVEGEGVGKMKREEGGGGLSAFSQV